MSAMLPFACVLISLLGYSFYSCLLLWLLIISRSPLLCLSNNLGLALSKYWPVFLLPFSVLVKVYAEFGYVFLLLINGKWTAFI